MSSVTYKNQPAIDATKGSVPLAGTSHVYTVGKVLWPEAVEEFIGTLLIPQTLHVCCGKSMLGDLRVDKHEQGALRADAVDLPFEDRSWETVLCDPPYNGSFKWNHDLLTELGRVASRRIIFQHWFIPADKQGRFKKDHSFKLSGVYVWAPKTYFGRAQVISVLDRD
jgi:hypothetical protein